MAVEGIDPARVPRHIAAVMDGNGRWAERRGLKRTEGHAAGEEALLDATNGCLDLGVEWFTVYAFSTENWKRPADEVRYLMGFNESLLVRRRDESLELTQHNTGMTFTIAFDYGGRAELVDAVRAIVAEGIPADKITDKTIAQHLYDPDMPDPDLMIRTSGEQRISNYLLWQLAYSELTFPDVLWPDFRREHLFEAVREYQERQRRFGGVERAT
jgi:undecaprenyl diphosphate synthase